MKLKYLGRLNPVVKGVGILKSGDTFECLKEVGERLLKNFPREYISIEKIEKKEKEKEVKKDKMAKEVKNKMSKPRKNKTK